MKSELDLFSVPPTQTSVEKGQWVEHNPVSLIASHGPIEFRVDGSEDQYVDLSETLIHIKVKIQKANGADIAGDEAVGPSNLFLHALFSQVDLFLNSKLVSSSSPTYAYRAMIETLLSYGSGAKTTQLQSALFYKDTPGKLDVVDIAADAANGGLKTRAALLRGGKTLDLMGRLHGDLFAQEKYLLPGVDLVLKCIRSSNAFCLLSSADDANYKAVIESASLWVRKVQISPSVRIAHEKALMKNNAKYPIHRVLINTFSIPQGNMNMVKDNIFHGQVPRKLVIGLVDSDAYNGAFKKNAFNFKHHSLTSLGVFVNGEPMPGKAMETKFTQAGGQQYINAYLSLFSGCAKLGQDKGNQISRADFSQGYSLFAFDLSPDLSEGGHLSLLRKGNLKVELKFGAGLPNPVIVLVYAEFDNLIEITRERNILFDYSD